MKSPNAQPLISVLIPVGERHADARELLGEYLPELDALGTPYELIIVLDGPQPDFAEQLQSLLSGGLRATVVRLSKTFGESIALMAGFEQAAGNILLTLPAYFQIEAAGIRALLSGLDEADVVTARRWPRAGGWFERMRRDAFHAMVAWVSRQRYNDLGCRARAMRRRVLEEISLYGDQHHFLSVLADRQGFRVREIDVRQSPKDRFTGRYRNREYAHRALDIFTIFFLVRFTKKPLRFFGMVGVTTFLVGLLFLLYLTVDRLGFHHPLAGRPALLLSSLLVVLGLQVFALGLLGELIIFTHARGIKDYQVEKVIQYNRGDSDTQRLRVDSVAAE